MRRSDGTTLSSFLSSGRMSLPPGSPPSSPCFFPGSSIPGRAWALEKGCERLSGGMSHLPHASAPGALHSQHGPGFVGDETEPLAQQRLGDMKRISKATLGKSLLLSKPQFPHLPVARSKCSINVTSAATRGSNRPYLSGWLNEQGHPNDALTAEPGNGMRPQQTRPLNTSSL